MPPAPKSGPALFLGIELGPTNFEPRLTHGGIFTTPGEAYTTPVEMWIKAIDTLLRGYTPITTSRVSEPLEAPPARTGMVEVYHRALTLVSRSPRTVPQHFPAPISRSPIPHRSGYPPRTPRLSPSKTTSAALTSWQAGSASSAREGELPAEVWGRTGRVQLASAFIGSLITGKWIGMSESEACATGMWVHAANPNNATGQGYWDEEVLEIVAGSRRMVVASGVGLETLTVGRLTEGWKRFKVSCRALWLRSSPRVRTHGYHLRQRSIIFLRVSIICSHPVQEAGAKQRYIAVLSSRNGDVPRAL
ncbi:hypothetical protein FA13DRAFT_1784031, partial [Coprinellus micaceus]